MFSSSVFASYTSLSLSLSLIITLLFFAHFPAGASSQEPIATITLINNGKNTVWVSIIIAPEMSSPPPYATDFPLQTGESHVIDMYSPVRWSQIWGRILCTGDECVNSYVNSPATVAELTLKGGGLNSYYRVSLVYGYNLAMKVEPLGMMSCPAAACSMDLNKACPEELKVIRNNEEVVGCQSGCQAIGTDCCSDCEPKFFKATCPNAYISAYNNVTYACPSPNFLVTFQSPDSSTSSLMEPVDNNNSSKLSSTVLASIISAILFGVGAVIYGAFKVRCYFSNKNFTAEVEVTAK